MLRTTTAPNPNQTIANIINTHYNHLAADTPHTSPYYNRPAVLTLGRYATAGGAQVDVDLRVEFSIRRIGPRDAWTVFQSTTARCTGHGCTTPLHEPPTGVVTPLGPAPNIIAMDGTEQATAVREWAQAHAETCRAMPYEAR